MSITRTNGRLHFEDLDPGRFEDLCLSMIYRMRRWIKIEHFGRTGADSAIDIQAIERLENDRTETWHFQCKRYQKLTKTEIRSIIKDYCEKNDSRPDYYCLVAGCDVSKKLREEFEILCSEKGFSNVQIWSSSEIEARLHAEYHDLLFAYFGVSLSDARYERISAIRRNIALKKRMHQDFYNPAKDYEEQKRRRGKPYLWFKSQEVLIRSIFDVSYPEVPEKQYGNGFFKAEVYDWYHNGLMVRAFPFAVNARVKWSAPPDIPEEERKEEIIRLEIMGCIPFENIIDYDMDGDEFYNIPHLYCEFRNPYDPFEEMVYYTERGYHVNRANILEIFKND